MFTADLHNRIANDPSVRPSFGHHEGATDLSPLLDEPENYILLADGEDAAAILEWSAPDIWQVHYMMLSSCRGRRALAAAKRMVAWMFEKEGARAIWGQTPMANRAARWLNRQVGCVSKGFAEREADGPCELFWLEAPSW